jgi:GNAT superfamily N-acetyltransferase
MKKFLDVLINMASLEGIWINHRLIYDAEGNVIGRIQVEYYDEHLVFINLIAIYPEYRNKGYFSQLLSLISRSADMNGDTLQLIPLATETSEIPASDISMNKLKKIYEEFEFEAEIKDVEVSVYTRKPNVEETNANG